jgi:hypothetical protein
MRKTASGLPFCAEAMLVEPLIRKTGVKIQSNIAFSCEPVMSQCFLSCGEKPRREDLRIEVVLAVKWVRYTPGNISAPAFKS